MDFSEVTGGLRPDSVLEGRAHAPEGTEKMPIIFILIGTIQRSQFYL